MGKHMLRYSEAIILGAMLVELGERKEAIISMAAVADHVKQTRGAATAMLQQAALAGLVRHHSAGQKGTWVRVLDRQALEAVVLHKRPPVAEV